MKLERDGWTNGHRSIADTLTFIPADEKIRPLRDQVVIELLELKYSDTLIIDRRERPNRGRVLAVGPGCYPKRYNHPDKHRRSKMWDSKAFRPCDLKVGDIVQFGSFAFDQYQWGDKRILILREEDVTAVETTEGLDSGRAA